MESTAVWIVVLSVSALGYAGTIVPDNPKHHIAFTNSADCQAYARVVRKDIPVPALVTLNRATCRKMEIRK